MDSYHCSSYSWISSTGISDPTFWESVFPCEKELEPAPKKQRLNPEDEDNEILNFGCQMNEPTYFDLSNYNINGQIDQNTFEKERKTHKDMSPTWEDFYEYMKFQESPQVEEPFTFNAPFTSPQQRHVVRNISQSNMVVIGTKVRYSCSLCSKTFPTSKGQKLHLHSHRSNNKNIQLTSSSPRPKVENDLNHKKEKIEIHQEYNHHRDEKKRFICPLCDRGFKVRQDLLVHIVSGACKRADRLLRRVTSGWECTSCDKLFDTRNKAECHTRTHTFGSGITCPVCNMDFTGSKGYIVVRHVKERHPEYFDELGC